MTTEGLHHDTTSINRPLPAVPDTAAGQARVPHPFEQLNRRWVQAFNDRDWTTERTLLRPEFRAYLSGATEPLDLTGWSAFIAAFVKGFPDSRITIDECIVSGNTVAARWHLTGTHQGEFQGIAPTGRAIAFTGLEYNHIVDGGFTEHWSISRCCDRLGAWRSGAEILATRLGVRTVRP